MRDRELLRVAVLDIAASGRDVLLLLVRMDCKTGIVGISEPGFVEVGAAAAGFPFSEPMLTI